MKPVTFLVCFAVVIGACLAELCLISPRQRGSMNDLNKAGSSDCSLTEGPCGNRSAETPVITYKVSSIIDVIVQKNFDCFARATPGYFSLSLWQGTDFKATLARMEDMGEPSLSLYTLTALLPADIKAGNYTIQTQYVTMNPLMPPVFYQCADILLY